MTIRNLAIAAACAAAACSTNQRNSGLVVERVVLATAGTDTTVADAGTVTTDTCPNATFDPTSEETLNPLFNPNDINTHFGLIAFVVSNQLVDPSTLNTTLRTDTRTFTPHQAVIDYEIVGGGANIPQQVVPASGTVDSGSTGTAVAVSLFGTQAAIAAMQAVGVGLVRTTTRIEGTLDDGSKASTSAHEFIVQVCSSAACPASTPCF